MHFTAKGMVFIFFSFIICGLLCQDALGITEPVFVAVEGKVIDFPDQKPFIDCNDHVLVPVRFPAQELGAEVTWIPEKQQIIIFKHVNHSTSSYDITIVATINDNKVSVNGCTHTMDSSPILVNNRVMVPVRFISEYLESTVLWDQYRCVVHVFKNCPSTREQCDIANQVANQIRDNPNNFGIAKPAQPNQILTISSEDAIQCLKDVAPCFAGVYEDVFWPKKVKWYYTEEEPYVFLSKGIKLKPNQVFETSKNLLFHNGTGAYGLRGILKTTNCDGTVTSTTVDIMSFNGSIGSHTGEILICGWHHILVYETLTDKLIQKGFN